MENKEKIYTEIDSTKLKILELKAQVLDMIRQQESLAIQNNQIQEAKIKLVEEINRLESQNK